MGIIKKDMQFSQSRFTNKITFDFQDEGVNYMMKDRSGSRTSFVRYNDFVLNNIYTITERNEYFRNVGILWFLIGIIGLSDGFRISIWLILGFVCLAVYYFVYTKYTVIPNYVQNCFVIQGKNHDEIIATLTQKVHATILEDVGEINYESTFENEKRKYNQLLKANIISESQFNEYLAEMESHKEKFEIETKY